MRRGSAGSASTFVKFQPELIGTRGSELFAVQIDSRPTWTQTSSRSLGTGQLRREFVDRLSRPSAGQSGGQSGRQTHGAMIGGVGPGASRSPGSLRMRSVKATMRAFSADGAVRVRVSMYAARRCDDNGHARRNVSSGVNEVADVNNNQQRQATVTTLRQSVFKWRIRRSSVHVFQEACMRLPCLCAADLAIFINPHGRHGRSPEQPEQPGQPEQPEQPEQPHEDEDEDEDGDEDEDEHEHEHRQVTYVSGDGINRISLYPTSAD